MVYFLFPKGTGEEYHGSYEYSSEKKDAARSTQMK